MKPICVPCQRFYRIEKNGYAFTEMMPIGDRATPGKAAPKQWQPYKMWFGDLWTCPDCGAQIVVGVAKEPFTEHYRSDFAQHREAMRAGQLEVKDC